MKSEVRFLHKFLKSIGFSEYTTTRKIQELVKDVIMNLRAEIILLLMEMRIPSW